MGLFDMFSNSANKENTITDYLKNGAVVLDVRTPSEFCEGHVKGSINIPLNVIQARFFEIKELNKPIIAVCLSGGRSGQATSFLKQQGIDVINGGPWRNVAPFVK